MAVGKRKRTSRKSKGINGASKVHLSEVQKVLLNKGMLARPRPVESK